MINWKENENDNGKIAHINKTYIDQDEDSSIIYSYLGQT